MQNTTHRHHGAVFNAVMSLFTGVVGDGFLMRCGFCALSDCLRFPASAEVCSSAAHSHFSVLGCGSKLICFCARVCQVSKGWISQQPGQEGTRGDGGVPVTLHRCCPISPPRSPCRAELGSHHCHTPLVDSWTQDKTDVTSRMKKRFLAVEFHLFPCPLHLSSGISDEEISLLIPPQLPLSLPFPP